MCVMHMCELACVWMCLSMYTWSLQMFSFIYTWFYVGIKCLLLMCAMCLHVGAHLWAVSTCVWMSVLARFCQFDTSDSHLGIVNLNWEKLTSDWPVGKSVRASLDSRLIWRPSLLWVVPFLTASFPPWCAVIQTCKPKKPFSPPNCFWLWFS